MGLGRSPALWAAALGGVAFAALFDLLSVKQEEKKQEAAEQQPAKVAPIQRPIRSSAAD